MAACSGCATENPAGARFCNGCGASLAAVSVPAREERKVVTVLFADLAGFTARAETLDPEEVRAFLLPYYDVLRSEVTRHGGTVDRYLGDGVMALFGAPTAHEDDPERAVRAALRILERLAGIGLDLHVRLGINTGPVLFDPGCGTERDDTVTGDAVNTAARLQALAPTDGVVVGEPTYRATAHLFRYEALPPTPVPGKAEPLSVWRPTAPFARPAGEIHAETTPFVGRDLELGLLVGLFERARWTPSVEFATVVAQPGLGKSRLVRELARHVDARPELVTWRKGRCLPYGDGLGLWALGEIVRSHAGILDTDDQAVLATKLDAVLVEPDPSRRAWMKDRLAPLVGLGTSTQPPTQHEAFAAWRSFLESIARGGPTVVVIEDLHWANDTLVSFLAHVAENTTGVPQAVALRRPDLLAILLSTNDGELAALRHTRTTWSAIAAEAGRRHDEALGLFLEAARGWLGFGDPYERAHALLGQGRCLVALGRPIGARGILTEAAAIFRRLGASSALADTGAVLAEATLLGD